MRITRWIAALGLLLVAPVTGSAQPVPVPDTWGGDLLSRPRLTGSWGGFRDEMGKKGIILDVDFILTPQAVATGGVDTGAGDQSSRREDGAFGSVRGPGSPHSSL